MSSIFANGVETTNSKMAVPSTSTETPAAQNSTAAFGPGFMYTAIPGESSAADSAHWNTQAH